MKRSHYWTALFASVAVCSVVFCLTFHFQAPMRRLWPWDLKGERVWAPLTTEFRLALGAGANFVDRSTGLAHLQKPESPRDQTREIFYQVEQLALEVQPDSSQPAPLARSVAPCSELTLTLHASEKSVTSSSCRLTPDGRHILLHFPFPLQPGLYDASFAQRSGLETFNLTTQGLKNTEGIWLTPLSHKTLSVAELLLDFYQQLPTRALIFAAAALFTTTALFSALGHALSRQKAHSHTKTTILLLMTALSGLLMHFAAAPPFSGHDETFHIDQSYQAYLREHRPELSVTEKKEWLRRFNAQGKLAMAHSHFYRFHEVSPPPDGRCMHSIITTCNDKPELLAAYAKIWRLVPTSLADKISSRIDRIRLFHQGINCAVLGFSLLLVFAAAGTSGVAGLLLALMTLLAPVTHLVTVTNDFWMFCLGIAGSAFLALGFVNVSLARKAAVTIGFLLMVWLLHGVDRSWATILPTLIAAPCILSARYLLIGQKPKSLPPKEPSGFHQGSNVSYLVRPIVLIVFLIITVAGALAAVYAWADSLAIALEKAVAHLPAFQFALPQIRQLAAAKGLDVSWAMAAWFRGLAGTFHWGNAYLPLTWCYLSGGVLLWAMSSAAIVVSNPTKGRAPAGLFTLFVLVIAGLGCAQVMMVLAAAGTQLLPNRMIFDSFLQARITAPGLAVIWLPFVLFRSRAHSVPLFLIATAQMIITLCAYRLEMY